jgi:hypothetical protein
MCLGFAKALSVSSRWTLLPVVLTVPCTAIGTRAYFLQSVDVLSRADCCRLFAVDGRHRWALLRLSE